jgi:vacuolar-type H+-ATPase subunit I/STV1
MVAPAPDVASRTSIPDGEASIPDGVASVPEGLEARPRSSFLHYELLGPRADLDAWLASVQDAGVCHLADALDDLEGHPGIGRPELRSEEIHAELLRSEAARALRGISRVLPPTPRFEGEARRPQWTLGPGGIGERDLHALKDEARALAASLAEALADVQTAEQRVFALDALEAACRALGAAGGTAGLGGIEVHALPRTRTTRRRARRLQRHLSRTGGASLSVLCAAGDRTQVLVVRPGVDAGADLASAAVRARLAASSGAEPIEVPAEHAGAALAEARTRLAAERTEAERVEAEARARLSTHVAQSGVRGRFLLDSLEDAERRTQARRLLASSAYVAAARLYVRPEDDATLRDKLHAAHGESVVLRPLPEGRDAPSLPRRIASSPFAVLSSLRAGRYGEVSAASVLAIFAPLAVGVVWADMAGGVFLLLAGALLGSGAGVGSPRRDTALLAQVGGLISLVLGVLAGRAFGPAGSLWFGSGWGLAPAGKAGSFVLTAAVQPAWAAPFLGVAWTLAAVALLAGLGRVCLAGWARARGRGAGARAALLGALPYLCVVGAATAFLPPTHVLVGAWVLAPLAAGAFLLIGGPRRFLLQFCLDLVGVLRLVAVAGAALLLFDTVLGLWTEPTLAGVLVGSLALLVAALAVVADPAHLAMGIPYDLALGGSRLGRPFAPFRRQIRHADLQRAREASPRWQRGEA